METKEVLLSNPYILRRHLMGFILTFMLLSVQSFGKEPTYHPRYYSGFYYDTLIIKPQHKTRNALQTAENMAWVNYYQKVGATDSLLNYIQCWHQKIIPSTHPKKAIEIQILLGERLQYAGRWDSARALFESLVPQCSEYDTLLLFVDMNLLKLASKLQLENYEWMKARVASTWKNALRLNEYHVITEVMQMAMSYKVTSVADAEKINFTHATYEGRKALHLSSSYEGEQQLESLKKAKKLITYRDPLYRFKLHAQIAHVHLMIGDYDSALKAVLQNERYAQVLNDPEVMRHHFQLFQAIYHYQGKEAQTHFYEKKIEEIEAKQQDVKRRGELKDLISNELTKSNRKLDKSNKTLTVTLIITVLLLSIILFLVWRTMKDQHKLKDKNRQLHQLFQVVSHDIQSPLSRAISKAQSKDYIQNELHYELLEIRDVTNGVLSWASKNLEGIKQQKQRVELSTLIQSEIGYFETSLIKKKLTINVSGEVFIETDPELFAIIIRNAIDNAIKYTPEKRTIDVCLDQKSVQIKNEIDTTPSGGTEKGMILMKSIAQELEIQVQSEVQKPYFILKLTLI